MKPQAILFKYHRIVLYVTTLGLAAYGILAIVNPEVLAGGFNRFTEQAWPQFQTDNHIVAAYIMLLWRLIGGFNLAIGLVLALLVWKWLRPGRRWAWTTLFLGTLIAYLSPMSLDLTVGSIEVFEVIEFLLFGVFVLTMLVVRKAYFIEKECVANEENTMNARKIMIILAHAFVGWVFCTATMTIGMAATTVENALVIHAVGAPIFVAAVSWYYFTKFNYTTPIQTATIFVAFAILMDVFVVSLLVLRNFEMFASLLGTWIPFALMFAAAYLMGTIVNKSKLTTVA